MTRAHLDPGAMRGFLSGEAVGEDGAVWSWVNPAHPGYAYPEAAGLVLAWLCRETRERDGNARRSDDEERRRRIAARLARDVGPRGEAGRDGVGYVFDTAMALAGLRAAGAGEGLTSRMAAFVRERLEAGAATAGDDGALPQRWSTRFAPHLLKCAIALDAAGTSAPGALAALRARQRPDGRFPEHDGSERTYLHACCYALEGIAHGALAGDASLAPSLRAGADFLARAQDASGGLRAFHDGVRASGPLRADATAQAARLWLATDRRRYAGHAQAALACLATLQHPRGGLRYEPASADVCTWATVFAAQAQAWHARGVALPFV